MSDDIIVVPATYNEVELKKFKWHLSQMINTQTLDITNIDVVREFGNRLLLNIEGFIWSEDLGKFDFPIPANWWESFKDAMFPKWLKKYFPVRYTKFSVRVKALYPDLKVAVPSQTLKVFKVTDLDINGVSIDRNNS